jgi:lipoprotein signal peptidase
VSDTETALPVAATSPSASAAAPREERPPAATLLLRFAFVAAIVALDLWSKSAVFAWIEPLRARGELVPDDCLYGHLRHPLVGDWLTIMLSLNPGAAFGQLQSVPYLLVGGRVVAVAFLVWWMFRTGRGRPAFSAALVLVLGGALGNLYDNLLRARSLDVDAEYAELPFGPVRDFIDVYFRAWDWHFPTFNVADACITLGAIMWLVTGFGSRPAAPPPEPERSRAV